MGDQLGVSLVHPALGSAVLKPLLNAVNVLFYFILFYFIYFILFYILFYLFYFILFIFLGLPLRHMEVPRLGVKLEL